MPPTWRSASTRRCALPARPTETSQTDLSVSRVGSFAPIVSSLLSTTRT